MLKRSQSSRRCRRARRRRRPSGRARARRRATTADARRPELARARRLQLAGEKLLADLSEQATAHLVAGLALPRSKAAAAAGAGGGGGGGGGRGAARRATTRRGRGVGDATRRPRRCGQPSPGKGDAEPVVDAAAGDGADARRGGEGGGKRARAPTARAATAALLGRSCTRHSPNSSSRCDASRSRAARRVGLSRRGGSTREYILSRASRISGRSRSHMHVWTSD